ncbi:MAG: BrnT family toxin [Anaerolineales bacterium]|nr:BrnT family toxin [Anaerolineales bacterium]
MEIDFIICPEQIEDKLASKHNVTSSEARQLLLNDPRIRFAEKGRTQGDDVYVAFGQTFGGRYLSVFFIYKPSTKTAVIISARDMTDKERKAYGRK